MKIAKRGRWSLGMFLSGSPLTTMEPALGGSSIAMRLKPEYRM